MKSRIENILLTLVTQKNSLPTKQSIIGSIKLSRDHTKAEFNEIPFFGKRKTFTMFHRQSGSVSLNTETDKYRIIINVDVKNKEWPLYVEDSFYDCMNYLARRTNA